MKLQSLPEPKELAWQEKKLKSKSPKQSFWLCLWYKDTELSKDEQLHST